MSDTDKHNLLYFESSSMRGLYDCMEGWQRTNNRRLLSTSIQRDGESYCCIALTNPTEVVITSADGRVHAEVFPASQAVRIGGRVMGGAPARLAVTTPPP